MAELERPAEIKLVWLSSWFFFQYPDTPQTSYVLISVLIFHLLKNHTFLPELKEK